MPPCLETQSTPEGRPLPGQNGADDGSKSRWGAVDAGIAQLAGMRGRPEIQEAVRRLLDRGHVVRTDTPLSITITSEAYAVVEGQTTTQHSSEI